MVSLIVRFGLPGRGRTVIEIVYPSLSQPVVVFLTVSVPLYSPLVADVGTGIKIDPPDSSVYDTSVKPTVLLSHSILYSSPPFNKSK